jgi:hypothetical protein
MTLASRGEDFCGTWAATMNGDAIPTESATTAARYFVLLRILHS